jgi:flagellar hook-basal body complex protein FliE
MIGGIPRLDLNLIGSLSGQESATSNATSAAGGVGASFGALLSEAATRTIGTLQQAEQVAIQGIRGEADTRAVVDAVMSAEQSLQAAVAIRDKIVSAYLEVSRMAI